MTGNCLPSCCLLNPRFSVLTAFIFLLTYFSAPEVAAQTPCPFTGTGLNAGPIGVLNAGDSICFPAGTSGYSPGDNVGFSGFTVGQAYTVSICGQTTNPVTSSANTYLAIWDSTGMNLVGESLGGTCGDGDDEQITFVATDASHVVVLRKENCLSDPSPTDLCIIACPLGTITTDPTDLTACPDATVMFAADTAGGGGADSLRWEVSTDMGTTWTILKDLAPYSGTNTLMLTINPTTIGLNGNQYRMQKYNCSPPIGRASAAATLTVEDNQDPVIVCPANQTANVDANCETVLPDYIGAATVTDNCTTMPTVTQSPMPGGTISGVPTTVPITLIANDGNSNMDTCMFDYIQVDADGPTINCPMSSDTVFLDATCTAMLPKYDTLFTITDNCDAMPMVTQSPMSGMALTGVGTITPVTLTLTDVSGNTTICSFNSVTADSSLPVLTCPMAQEIFLDGNCDGVLGNYVPLTSVTDNCTSMPAITQLPIAGTVVTGTGLESVTMSSDDGNGNVGNCLVFVNKIDNTPPNVTCPPNQAVPSNAFCQVILPNFADLATVADNCDTIPGIIQNPSPSTPLSGGFGTTQSITLTATDINGNSSDCSFTITIGDTTRPMLTCPTDQNVVVDASCSAILSDYVGSTSAVDNCDPSLTITQSPMAGTVLSANNSPVSVTMSVADAAMNARSCTFLVTVQDNDAPVLICPPNQTVGLTVNCTDTLLDYTLQTTTTDNCTMSPTLMQSPAPGTVFSGVGSAFVTITSEDAFANSNTCTFEVMREDTTRPTLNCPVNQNFVVDANCGATLPDYLPQAGITDNCTANPTNTQTPPAGSTFTGIGTPITVTLMTSDASSNSNTCSFVATLADQTAPTVTCPPNQTLVTDASCSVSIPDYLGQASVADNCDSNPSLVQSPVIGSTATGANSVVTVTITGTDASSNQDDCSFSVTLADNTPPVIGCPVDQTLTADTVCAASLPDFTALASTSDNCDVSPLVTQAPMPGTVLTGSNTTQAVVLTIADVSGNVDSCSFQTTVLDQTPPVLDCPPSQNLSVDANCEALIPVLTPTVTDNCDGNPLIVQSPLSGTVLSGAGTTQGVTFSATDVDNNNSTCTLTLTLVDQSAPVITCPANQTLVVDSVCEAVIPDYVAQTSASDNCTALPTISQAPLGDTIQAPAVVTITMMAGDASSNTSTCTFTVTAQDTTRPQLACPTNPVLPLGANCTAVFPDYRTQTVTSDNCTTTPIVVQNPPPGSTPTSPGLQTVSISVTDAFNNVDSCVFNVAIQDTTAPSINCPNPLTLILDNNCQTTMTDYLPSISVSDNCNSNPTVTQVPAPNSTVFGGGTLPVKFTVDDGNGNLDSCTIIVTIFDLVAPQITCPPGTTLVADANCSGIIPDFTTGATVVDNCSNQIAINQIPVAGTTIAGGGSTASVVLSAIDSTGNQDTCSVSVLLLDVTAPVLTGCPSNITITPTTLDCNPAVQWTPPLATDACGATLSGTSQPGDNFPIGTTGVSYTATDSSGNTDFCAFTVTVNQPQLDSLIVLSDSLPCAGDTVFLSAPGNFTSYGWSTTDTAPTILVFASGIYWVDVADSTNCAGRDSVQVTFQPLPTPAITQVGLDLCAGAFVSYQWVENGTQIPGATGSCITPLTSGTYSVIVVDSNGCSSESMPFVFVGATEAGAAQDFELFPNPTNGYLTVRMEQPLLEAGEVRVWDLTGRVVKQMSFDKIDAPLRLDLRKITQGTYLVEIRSETFIGRKKVVRIE